MNLGIKPIRNNILFTFVEDVVNGAFQNKTSWNFQIRNPVNDVKLPRWGKVKAIGDDVKHINVDEYVFIEPLMWTLKLEYNGNEYWGTNEDKVIAVSKELPKI